MKTIEWTDINPTINHGEAQFYCYASDLELPSGNWPHFLKTGLGNGQDMVRQYRDGDNDGFLYRQESGTLRLLILNY